MKRSVSRLCSDWFLEATDREAVRPIVVVRRIDIAIVVKVQVVRVVAVWSN